MMHGRFSSGGLGAACLPTAAAGRPEKQVQGSDEGGTVPVQRGHCPPAPAVCWPPGLPACRRTAEKEESNGAYNMLLRSELLGCPPAVPISPEKGAGMGMLPSTSHPGSPSKR